jgi:predicted RecB family nuclease
MGVVEMADAENPVAATLPRTTSPTRVITATMLADIVRCEMRAYLDIHGDADDRAPLNGFVEMLFAQGSRHEQTIVAALPGSVIDLTPVPMHQRFEATLEAMRGEAEWIVGARLLDGDLEGRPDLLQRDGAEWQAGDIKSGSAFQPNGRDPRREYAVQAGLYGRMIERLGMGSGRRVFIIGADGSQSWYELGGPISRGGGTVAQFVDHLIDRARAIRDGGYEARPASSALCGLCVWKAECGAALKAARDITLVPGLGRSLRPAIEGIASNLDALAEVDVDALAADGGRTVVPGVGMKRLLTFRERARMIVSGAAPFAIEPLGLSRQDVEHRLDLETDPTSNDFCYLHGILRRVRGPEGDVEDYVHFLAPTPDEEKSAFAAAVDFLSADPTAAITTFSAFEKSTYLRLVKRYPEVGVERVEALFERERCVDLYFDAVLPKTHWPVNSLGLKSLAKYAGFDWNDPDASGAASIQWFVEWTETRDPALLARILKYNMNDTIASRVVFDALISLPVQRALPWPHVQGMAA